MLHIRAFSLFAPLVGTSVMIIAVVVASVLVSNDIRTSRGITSSYARGELSSLAESIRAYVFATTADTVINSVYSELSVPPRGPREVVCADSADCKSKMGGNLTTALGTSTVNGLVGAYGLAVPAFIGSVYSAQSDWDVPGGVKDKLAFNLVGTFERGDPLKGEDSEGSYVTITPGSLTPEDYTLKMTKGGIIESVPLLPPKGLRIRMPWGVHNMSDALADASGGVLNDASSGALDVAQTCTWKPACCGKTGCGCCASTGYTLSGKLATDWGAGIVQSSGSGCPSIGGILNDASAASAIKAYLKRTTIPDFDLSPPPLVQVSGTSSSNAPSSSPSSCSATKGSFSVGSAKIKMDWSLQSKNAPTLSTELIFRNG